MAYYYIVNHLSFWWILLYVIILFLFFSYVSSRVALIFWPEKNVSKIQWDFLNTVLSIACSGFFVLIIFTTLNAWSYMNVAREACSEEAAAIIGIMRSVSYFPEGLSGEDEIIKAAENYAINVRTIEWLTMHRGKESPQAIEALTRLIASIEAFRPQSNAFNNTYYNQLIQYVVEINNKRHSRLVKMNSVVPVELQHAILVGSMILTILLGLLCRSNEFAKVLPVLFFDIILAYNVTLCFCMSYPFSGLGVENNMYYTGILAHIPLKN